MTIRICTAIALLGGCLPAVPAERTSTAPLAADRGDASSVAIRADTPTVETTLVTVREGTELVAALSPDGQRIAFILLGQVWLIDARGGRAVALTDPVDGLAEYWSIAWAPDSRRLALFTPYADVRGVYVMDVDSRATTYIGDAGVPVWSADGATITVATASPTGTELWSFAPDGSRDAVRTGGLPAPGGHLSYAPDGRFVAYAAPLSGVVWPTARTDLWELEPETGHVRRLTASFSLESSPAYSPDGRWIAFISERSGSRQLWLLERETGDARPLTRDAQDVYIAPLTWAPDSRTVLYTAEGQMRLASIEGAPERRIEFEVVLPVARWTGLRRPDIPEPGERRSVRGIVDPELSPDGGHVAFSALGDLWIASVAGGTPVRLTDTPGDVEVQPRWSPDGASIAYVAIPDVIDAEVRLLRIDDPGKPRVLPIAGGRFAGSVQLSWSPDGRMLAFRREDGSIGHVSVADGSVRMLAEPREGSMSMWLAGWSAGGDSIVFASQIVELTPPSGYRVRQRFWQVGAAEGGRAHERNVPEEFALRARWSPGLARVAYVVGGVGYHAELHDPATRTRLPDPAARHFSWSADGRYLLYRSAGTLRLFDAVLESARTIDVALDFDVPQAPPPLLIRGAVIIDGTGREPSPPRDVLVRDGRIHAIAPAGTIAAGRGTRAIDAGGRSLLPGFFNVHIHRPPGPAALYNGVLAVRDLTRGTEWWQSYREQMEAGRRLSPRIFLSGTHIEADRGRHDFHHVDPQSDESIANEIATQLVSGAEVVKIRMRDPPLDARATAAAHAQGLPVTSHYVFTGTLARGLEGKEHIDLFYRGSSPIYRQDVLSLLRAGDVCVTPTLMTYSLGRMGGRSELAPIDSSRYLAHGALLAPQVLEMARALLRDRDAPVTPADEQNFRTDLANVRRLADAGVRMATGTDMLLGGDDVVQFEMAALVAGGLTPLEAIRAATLDAARCIGVEDRLGSIEVGKLADFVIVDGNPASDIDATHDIVWISLGGRLYTRQEIVESATKTRILHTYSTGGDPP